MLSTRGISLEGDVLDLAVADRIVEKSGSWFSYGKTRLGQGRDRARTTLEENPEMLAEIRDKVLVARGHSPKQAPAPEAEASA
jgi:recombination protein RecA